MVKRAIVSGMRNKKAEKGWNNKKCPLQTQAETGFGIPKTVLHRHNKKADTKKQRRKFVENKLDLSLVSIATNLWSLWI